VEQLTVNVTKMFRDPTLFKTLREQVLPILATHPFPHLARGLLYG